MGLVGGLARGIDDQQQAVAEVGDHQIVPDAAAVVGEKRVPLATRLQRDDIGRHEPFQRKRRMRDVARLGAKRDLAHVRDVEQSGRGARVQMLLQDAGRVLNRHLVAGERNQPAPPLDVKGMERCALENGAVICVVSSAHASLLGPAAHARRSNPLCRET